MSTISQQFSPSIAKWDSIESRQEKNRGKNGTQGEKEKNIADRTAETEKVAEGGGTVRAAGSTPRWGNGTEKTDNSIAQQENFNSDGDEYAEPFRGLANRERVIRYLLDPTGFSNEEAADDPLQMAIENIQQWVSDKGESEASALLDRVFGKSNVLGHLHKLLSKGALPRVEYVGDDVLKGGALGAYSSRDGGTIFIHKKLLRGDSNEQLKRVMLEEFGHHLDAQIGGDDAAGDEGALFADLVLGTSNKHSNNKNARTENDHGTIQVNGERLAVEFSEPDSASTPPPEGDYLAPSSGPSAVDFDSGKYYRVFVPANAVDQLYLKNLGGDDEVLFDPSLTFISQSEPTTNDDGTTEVTYNFKDASGENKSFTVSYQQSAPSISYLLHPQNYVIERFGDDRPTTVSTLSEQPEGVPRSTETADMPHFQENPDETITLDPYGRHTLEVPEDGRGFYRVLGLSSDDTIKVNDDWVLHSQTVNGNTTSFFFRDSSGLFYRLDVVKNDQQSDPLIVNTSGRELKTDSKRFELSTASVVLPESDRESDDYYHVEVSYNGATRIVVPSNAPGSVSISGDIGADDVIVIPSDWTQQGGDVVERVGRDNIRYRVTKTYKNAEGDEYEISFVLENESDTRPRVESSSSGVDNKDSDSNPFQSENFILESLWKDRPSTVTTLTGQPTGVPRSNKMEDLPHFQAEPDESVALDPYARYTLEAPENGRGFYRVLGLSSDDKIKVSDDWALNSQTVDGDTTSFYFRDSSGLFYRLDVVKSGQQSDPLIVNTSGRELETGSKTFKLSSAATAVLPGVDGDISGYYSVDVSYNGATRIVVPSNAPGSVSIKGSIGGEDVIVIPSDWTQQGSDVVEAVGRDNIQYRVTRNYKNAEGDDFQISFILENEGDPRPRVESAPTDADDTIIGGDGDDQLQGLGGSDAISGGLGDDTIEGGRGDDTLRPGLGSNVVNAGDGDDLIYSEGGADRIDGGAGNDKLKLDGALSDYQIKFSNGSVLLMSTSGQETRLKNIELIELDGEVYDVSTLARKYEENAHSGYVDFSASTRLFLVQDTNLRPNFIHEKMSIGDEVGVTISARERNGSEKGRVVYTLTDNANGLLAIDNTTGVVTLARVPTAEESGRISFEVSVSDAVGNVEIQQFSVEFTDLLTFMDSYLDSQEELSKFLVDYFLKNAPQSEKNKFPQLAGGAADAAATQRWYYVDGTQALIWSMKDIITWTTRHSENTSGAELNRVRGLVYGAMDRMIYLSASARRIRRNAATADDPASQAAFAAHAAQYARTISLFVKLTMQVREDNAVQKLRQNGFSSRRSDLQYQNSKGDDVFDSLRRELGYKNLAQGRKDVLDASVEEGKRLLRAQDIISGETNALSALRQDFESKSSKTSALFNRLAELGSEIEDADPGASKDRLTRQFNQLKQHAVESLYETSRSLRNFLETQLTHIDEQLPTAISAARKQAFNTAIADYKLQLTNLYNLGDVSPSEFLQKAGRVFASAASLDSSYDLIIKDSEDALNQTIRRRYGTGAAGSIEVDRMVVAKDDYDDARKNYRQHISSLDQSRADDANYMRRYETEKKRLEDLADSKKDSYFNQMTKKTKSAIQRLEQESIEADSELKLAKRHSKRTAVAGRAAGGFSLSYFSLWAIEHYVGRNEGEADAVMNSYRAGVLQAIGASAAYTVSDILDVIGRRRAKANQYDVHGVRLKKAGRGLGVIGAFADSAATATLFHAQVKQLDNPKLTQEQRDILLLSLTVDGLNTVLGATEGVMNVLSILAKTGSKLAGAMTRALPLLGIASSMLTAIQPSKWQEFSQRQGQIDDIRERNEHGSDDLADLNQLVLDIETGMNVATTVGNVLLSTVTGALAASGVGAPIAAIVGLIGGIALAIIEGLQQVIIEAEIEDFVDENVLVDEDGNAREWSEYFDENFKEKINDHLEGMKTTFDNLLVRTGADNVFAGGTVGLSSSEIQLAGQGKARENLKNTVAHFFRTYDRNGQYSEERVDWKNIPGKDRVTFQSKAGEKNHLLFSLPLYASGDENFDFIDSDSDSSLGKNEYRTSLSIEDMDGWHFVDGAGDTIFNLRNSVERSQRAKGEASSPIDYRIDGGAGDDAYRASLAQVNFDGQAGEDIADYNSLGSSDISRGIEVEADSNGLSVTKYARIGSRYLEGTIEESEVKTGSRTDHQQFRSMEAKSRTREEKIEDSVRGVEKFRATTHDDHLNFSASSGVTVVSAEAGDDFIRAGGDLKFVSMGAGTDETVVEQSALDRIRTSKAAETEDTSDANRDHLAVDGGSGIDTVTLSGEWVSQALQKGTKSIVSDGLAGGLTEDGGDPALREQISGMIEGSLGNENHEELDRLVLKNVEKLGIEVDASNREHVYAKDEDGSQLPHINMDDLSLRLYSGLARNSVDGSLAHGNGLKLDLSKDTAAAGVSITGSAGSDEIIGSSGGDTIDGGLGDDVINGGAGDDRILNSEGADTYVFEGDFGNDEVYLTPGSSNSENDRLVFKNTSEVDEIYRHGNDLIIYMKAMTPGAERNSVRVINAYDGDELQLGIDGYDSLRSDGSGNVSIDVSETRSIEAADGNKLAEQIYWNKYSLPMMTRIYRMAEVDTYSKSGSNVIIKNGSGYAAPARRVPLTQSSLESSFNGGVTLTKDGSILVHGESYREDGQTKVRGARTRTQTNGRVVVDEYTVAVRQDPVLAAALAENPSVPVYHKLRDVTGDGIDDYIVIIGSKAFVAQGLGNNAFKAAQLATDSLPIPASGEYQLSMIDVNEDGRSDILVKHGGKFHIAFATEHGSFSHSPNPELVFKNDGVVNSRNNPQGTPTESEQDRVTSLSSRTVTTPQSIPDGYSSRLPTSNSPSFSLSPEAMRNRREFAHRKTQWNDVVTGTASGNLLQGGGGSDRLLGMGGDDIIDGGDGIDFLDGGAGFDIAQYTDNSRGIKFDLSGSQQEWWRSGNRWLRGDQVSNFEGVIGTRHADELYGNNESNYLNGGPGDDIIEGRGGDDLLLGGSGDDTFRFGSSSGNDVVHSYQGSNVLYYDDPEITPESFWFMRQGDDLLIITHAGSSAQSSQKVSGFYTTPESSFRLRLSDGSELSHQGIVALANVMSGKHYHGAYESIDNRVGTEWS